MQVWPLCIGHFNPTLCLVYSLYSVLVIQCCKTNGHTPSALKQHPFISSVGQKSDGSVGFHGQRIAKLQSRCRLGWAFIWSVGEASVSKAIRVGGRIQLFTVVELKPLFSWLSARSCSQLLEITHIPCHVPCPISKPAMVPLIHLNAFALSDFPSAMRWRKPSHFKASWLSLAHLDNPR